MNAQANENTRLIEVLFDIFREHGYEGTTISLLSQVTGLQKSSLYHHFPAGKDDMLKAVINYVGTQVQQHIVVPLLDANTKPEDRFEQMLGTVKAFYHDGRKNCLLNVLNLGSAKPEVRELLFATYGAWLEALKQLAEAVGQPPQQAAAWAERFLIVLEGSLVIQRLSDHSQVFATQMQIEKQYFDQHLNSPPKFTTKELI